MGEELTGMLLSLLIILKVFGSTEASCSLRGSYAYCRNQNLTSVPQDLPTGTTRLYLENNLITTLDQSDFSRYGKLTNLYLNGNRLSNITSDMFTGLGNLQYLFLYNNEISDIQAGTFSSTPQLRILYLSSNKLRNPKYDMFTGPENLETIYLENNEISDIQAGTFNSTPQLRTLYLRNNKLRNPKHDMFTGPENLETLYLQNNEISNIQAGTFNSTPQLRTLQLSHNKLTNLRSDMFTGLGNLETLYFYSNEISDIQAGTFNSTPQLRTLSLGNNKLRNPKSDMFTGPENLEQLILNYNEISEIQAGTFNSTPQLRTLSLHNNKLTNLRSDMFTGLGNLQFLYLYNNEISDIQAGTFNSTPQLRYLYLHQNKLTNLRSDMFTGLGNLQFLYLHNNEISDIQAGTLHSTPQLQRLYLRHNRLTVLKAEIFAELSSLRWFLYIDNNPWQCDCRMVPFRQKMTGSHSLENQITCEGPRNFQGQKLKDIHPEDLICEESTIVRFDVVHNNTFVEGETLHLVCEVSGIPTPDITVILPSGLTATVESDGRVTVEENGTITITNVTAADAGLYVCIATSPFGLIFATLVVDVDLKENTTSTVAPVTSPPYIVLSKQPQLAPSFSLTVLIGSVCGSVVGTVLVGIIILTIWHKRKTQNPPSPSTPPVVYSNASAMVTIAGHDQTGQGGAQTTSKIFKNAGSLEHTKVEYADIALSPSKTKNSPSPSTPPVVYSNASAKVTIAGHDQTGQGGAQTTSKKFKNAKSSEHVEVEYADIVLTPSNTETNVARQTQQPAEYQSLGTNRNRAPSDELPPLPPPSNRNNGGATGAHDTPRYYQSLKKKT